MDVVAIFDMIAQGWSRKAGLERVQQLLTLMPAAGLEPSVRRLVSACFCFLCFSFSSPRLSPRAAFVSPCACRSPCL
jgi:hypothetical protein